MPRKKKTTRRRKKQGISLLGVAETYMLLNVATQAAFKTTPVQFFLGGKADNSHNISLAELINPKGRFYNNPNIPGVQGPMYYITDNLKKNWVKGAVAMVTIPLAFRMGKALARPAINRTNRLLMKSGVGRTLKV